MTNDLIWNIIISLYNDIFDHRKGNKMIYYNYHFYIELKTLILLGGISRLTRFLQDLEAIKVT